MLNLSKLQQDKNKKYKRSICHEYKMMEQFESMDTDMLASKVGGKTIYYGNGLYCDNSKGCWVNWPEAIK